MKPQLLYYLLLLFTLLSPLSLRAADHEQLLEMPLDELYALLDKTLASADEFQQQNSADEFQQQKKARIEESYRHYLKAKTPQQRYSRAYRLFDEYKKNVNDSALKYARVCVDMANQIAQDSLIAESRLLLARQYANSGNYEEARKYLESIAPATLSRQQKTRYFSNYRHLYGELAMYGTDPELVKAYWGKADSYRDSLMNNVDKDTPVWLQQSIYLCLGNRNYNEALDHCAHWKSQLRPDTPEYAEMAFVTSEVYKEMGNETMQKRWLAISALSDLRCSIMNQASLWMLAGLLSQEGDNERAYRYIDYSWKCASQYNAHLRSWQISPILTTINDRYKSQLSKTNRLLWMLVAVVSLLSVVLLALYIYVARKRRQLATAQHELRKANAELASLNSQLQETNHKLSQSNTLLQQTNEQLSQTMMRLNDSNRVKDEYIGKFLNICSEYIDKLDNYRKRVNRKLKAGQHADLLRMTGSEQLKEDELKELFDNFDSVFLNLFPTFIDDFNALLKPEERITPPSAGRLNTDLRIFALIRLGIDESSKIADFLRYSPNSIYAYRARIKNKAAGERENFERMVKEIGM